MNSKPEKTVYIEYCRSCDTHNWCTHHDETKYHQTFLKLSELLAQHFPEIEVIGNMVPPHLIPFKISENKYIDSQTNKYVVYPQIGSFQVRFNNVTVYSKKDNNSWPNLAFIVSKIGYIMDPNYNSPPKNEKQINSSKKEEEIIIEKQEQNNRFIKLEDEKRKVCKDQSKGFTLTDHFKLYRQKAKQQEKDWLTEKPQSQGSFRQFLEQFRVQSRQKSEKSQDQKRRRDFNGQTKLKQMLKSRGLMLKQQGKKEMIIKLDSIEEENANYQQVNGATQRTQEIIGKKNKMQQLEDDFSSLQNRFKNFENKVHDIHTKKRLFQYKQQSSKQQSRFNNGQVKIQEFKRKQSKKQQVAAQKENCYFYQRANKLDQYVNASEEEKNQKLYKIYGEWKYLKQTAQKNKKLLKNKRRNSQEQPYSEQQSQAHSNSSSYIGNVITFKPKNDKSTPKLIKNLSKEKGHKYSTLEKYDSNKAIVTEPQFRTGEHFYNGNMKNQQYLSTENEQQVVHTSGKLLKKTLGNMSLEALKKHGSKETLIKLQKPLREQLSQFSESAQNNIRQIQSRITNIQNKLKVQKDTKETPSFRKPNFNAIKNVYSNKQSRSGSKASDYSARNGSKKQTYKKNKNKENNFRNSHRHCNQKNLRYVAKQEVDNKGKDCIAQAPSNDYKKQGVSQSEAIQQENELLDSNNLSFTELRHEIKNDRKHYNKTFKKNSPSNNRLKSIQRANRESTSNTDNFAFIKKQEKILKSESNQSFKLSQPQKINNGNPFNYQEQRISKMETDVTHNNKQCYQKTQKQSRIGDHPLNQQLTILRKKKEWRQSQPVKKNKKQRHLRQSEEQQEDNLIEESEERSKLSESKNTVLKAKKQMKLIQNQNSSTPKKIKNKHSNQPEFNEQRQKPQFGCIRKNKSRQTDVFRFTERQFKVIQRYGQQNQQTRVENGGDSQQKQQQRESYELEEQQEQNEGQLAESYPCMLHLEKSGNYKQESKQLEKKMFIKSQKSQMNKANRKQNLNYYKSEQVYLQGEKKQNTVSYQDSSLRSEKTQTNGLQRKSSIHQQTSEKGISGWKFNSEQEGQSDQIIINVQEQSAENHEEKLRYEELESSKLRNSLDLELENDEQQLTEYKQQKQSDVKKQQQKQYKQIINSKGSQVQKQRRVQNSQQKQEQQTKQQQRTHQKQEAALNSKQKTVESKRKLQKIKTKLTKQILSLSIKTELQPQSLITQQYIEYLSQILVNRLAKQATKAGSTKKETKQTTKYQDCDIVINLIICPSISSIGSHKSINTVPTSFMDYKPLQIQTREQQYLEDKNDVQIQEQKVQENNPASQSKEVDKYVDEVNQSIIASSFCLNKFQDEQTTEIKKLQKITKAENKRHPTVSLQPKTSERQHPNSPALINSKLPITPITQSYSTLKQQNNVYNQAKQINRCKQIGIQKQLTLEVSIQTDHPPQDLTADLFIVRGNSTKSNQVHNQSSSHQPHRRKVQMANTIFQEKNPVKNNYLYQIKQETFFQKKKPAKQLERAHIIDKIYSPNLQLQAKKFTYFVAGAEQDIQKQEGPVIKMVDFYLQGELFSPSGIEPQLIQTKFTRLLKVVEILCEKSEWLITRLFQDKNGVLKEKGFGVWLCRQYQWDSIIVDDAILINEQNHPTYSFHRGFQMWFNVLEKAVAAALGGYENLMRAETGQLFTLLTGCNSITSKIKQDPNKNKKLLLLVNDCLHKNYVIHAQKSDKSKKERENIYYIRSIRKTGGDEETLIELSQNNTESFWIKLSKFVTDFCKIEVLQLRINHNFTHLDLGVGRPGRLTVVQLQFQEEAQGSVTLSYLGQSAALRAFLYKQQKNKVLKLIGQAKQKNKSHLFFECTFTEGKYYVFAQAEQRPARLAFLGESYPRLTITEQIHSQGLKNEMAEYLPVRQNDNIRMKRSDMDSQLQWRGRIPRLQDNFVQSRLRENFISYVLGKTKY